MSRTRSITSAASACVLALGVGFAGAAQDVAAQEWKPNRPVQFVIQTTPGGGSDQIARFWASLIEKYDLSPQPVVPVNMPGGGGAVALNFLRNQAGDAHFISPTLNSVVTRPLIQKIPGMMYPSRDLTPLVRMMTDPFMLWTNPNTFANFDEFREACNERRVTGAMTGSKQEDEFQITMMERAMDCEHDFRLLPQPGGGDVASLVAGQQVDFSVNQPREGLPFYPERMHPILAFAKKRMPEFPDVPTHVEKGVNGDWGARLSLEDGLHQLRGVLGTPDLTEAQQSFWHGVFRKISETDEWAEWMAKGAMQPTFMTGKRFAAWLCGFEKGHVELMQDLGVELRDDWEPRGQCPKP